MEIEKTLDKIYGNMRIFGQYIHVLAKTDGTNEKTHVFLRKRWKMMEPYENMRIFGHQDIEMLSRNCKT